VLLGKQTVSEEYFEVKRLAILEKGAYLAIPSDIGKLLQAS
jgi:hypothetical protein